MNNYNAVIDDKLAEQMAKELSKYTKQLFKFLLAKGYIHNSGQGSQTDKELFYFHLGKMMNNDGSLLKYAFKEGYLEKLEAENISKIDRIKLKMFEQNKVKIEKE